MNLANELEVLVFYLIHEAQINEMKNKLERNKRDLYGIWFSSFSSMAR